MPQESNITKSIMRYLKGLDCSWWFKVWGSGMMQVGIPDIVGLYHGRFVAFEVKQPGKQPSKIQAHIIGLIRAAGGIAEVVTSRKEAEEIICRLQPAENSPGQ